MPIKINKVKLTHITINFIEYVSQFMYNIENTIKH